MELIGVYQLYVCLIGLSAIFGLYRIQRNVLEDEVIALEPGDEEKEEKLYELKWDDQDKQPTKPKKVRDMAAEAEKKKKARQTMRYIKSCQAKVRWAERRLLLYPSLCKAHTRLRAVNICKDMAEHFDLATRKLAREVLQKFAEAECSRKGQKVRNKARQIIVEIYPNMAEVFDLAA